MLCPKISTSWEKLAPTGRHGRHVFATLIDGGEKHRKMGEGLCRAKVKELREFWRKDKKWHELLVIDVR